MFRNRPRRAKDPPRHKVLVARLLAICVTTLTALAWAVSQPLQGQSEPPRQTQACSIVGTVTDVNGNTVAHAKVLLAGPNPDDRHTAITNDNGFFEFHGVRPGVSYHVIVSEGGFADWRSPIVTVAPNQSKILTGIRLRLAAVRTTVKVTPQSAEQVATEQVKQQEKQRILGIIPNFYVVYGPNFVPLTAKLKFRLAMRTSIDPVTFVGVAFVAGLQQAGDTPDFGQGAQGYAKRFGADYANGFTDIMIGGAILPSLLHQDPRYFFQGTGTIKSRMLHAMSNPFVCKGDNGKLQPNYSSVGGDLASAAISNTYYPESNRGVGRTFTSFAINTGARVAASLAQEFLLHKVTRKASNSK